ncbi:MAG: RNA polymerase factor sigma-32 [Deltaproteobacteria bacterium]|nr:RNA polymerase factor sigma-32 [Deltaproteobacteria bacterium]
MAKPGKRKQGGPEKLARAPRKPMARSVKPRKPQSVSITGGDPMLAAYLRETHRYPILSREEEHELAVRFHNTRDRDAFHKLITANLRFVVKIAYEYVHYRVRLLDLIQEGNTGLVKAVQEFNPYKEVRLTTYAVWWIRSYIQEAILRNYSLVKLGTTQAQKRLFYRLRAEQKKLEQLGMAPDVKLLASRLEVREKDIQEMDQRLSQHDLSLNAPYSEGEKKQHIDHLADSSQPIDVSLGDAEQKTLFKQILGQFAETLEGREKVFFDERLVSENPRTLQELGDRYGVTKERARQIEEHIKEKLKSFVKERYPDYDLLTGDRT